MFRRTFVTPAALAILAGSAIATCPPSECTDPQAQVVAVAPQPEVACLPATPEIESRIDVVFVLDTTGSMSGLIEGAKAKIWSIANQIASAKPRPQVRMGLVAYRDVGDEYVTKITSLTDDLDAVYADLMKFAAGGGGDTPESVNQALNEAVTKFDWQPTGDQYLKLIYLVGDCPPHMDYPQDVKYLDSCKLAATAGITINTVQCGGHAETTPIWQEIARSAEGEFLQIDQSGGMQAMATPFDEEIALLGVSMEGTVVAFGSFEEQGRQLAKMDTAYRLSSAPSAPEARAERAAYKASAAGVAALCGENDLVQACADGRVKLADLKNEDLPEKMRSMTPPQREAYVKEQAAARAECQAKIAELSGKRQAFIKDKLAEAGPADSFDARILQCLRVQAAKRGIVYAEK